MERIKNLEDYITSVKISNHLIFTDVERFVCVTSQRCRADLKIFEFEFVVRSFIGNEEKTVDFKQKNTSVIASKNTRVLLRDENNLPIPNSSYVPSEDATLDSDYDKYLWVTGWDMILSLLENPIVIKDLISFYVAVNAADSYFD